MKKLFFLGVVAMVSLATQAQFSKGTLQASGLTCSLCGNAVNKAIEKLPFIETVRTDIKNMSFSLSFKEAAEVDIDAIKGAVEEAGFSVSGLQLTGDFGEQKIENDKHIKIGKANYHILNSGSKTIAGENTITVLDKNFVTDKDFKKIKKYTKMKCIETGKAGTCCEKEGIAPSARIYHVSI